jgi:ubiquinone/menaquinone biosynthesis C-methylase UbiE
MKTAEFFDKYSKEYESQDRYKRLYYRWLIGGIVREIGKEDGDTIDIGTGTGNLAVRIALKHPASRILGNDVSRGMIREAKAKCKRMGIANVRFKQGPAEGLRIGRIDFAVSSLVFHHIKDKERVISDIYAGLAPNGKLVIGDWFEPTRQYKREINELRRKNPERTARFDKSWEESLKGMSGNYGKEHPKEYPYSQTSLVAIMKEAGFRQQRVVKSPLPTLAIVVGTK